MCVHTKLLLRLPAEAETFWQRVKSSPKPSNDCWLVGWPVGRLDSCIMPGSLWFNFLAAGASLIYHPRTMTHRLSLRPPVVTNNRRFSWHLAVFICCISTRTMPVVEMVEMSKSWPIDSTIATLSKFHCRSAMARIFAYRHCPLGHRGLRWMGVLPVCWSVGLSVAGFRTTFIKFGDACCNVTRQFKVQH